MINSCICSKCGKWHSHTKKDYITGKYVCIDCYYKVTEKKENNKIKEGDKNAKLV